MGVNKEGCKDGGSAHIAAHTFTFRELAVAAKNFRADCLLGEGGFGRVYRGRLESTNQVCQIYRVYLFIKLFISPFIESNLGTKGYTLTLASQIIYIGPFLARKKE